MLQQFFEPVDAKRRFWTGDNASDMFFDELRIFGLIPYFMKGTQATQKEVQMDKGRKVVATAVSGTLPVHCDGETVCFKGNELTVELLPAQIEFVTNNPVA